jgi:DNA-binding CsgD family transcriptional regulator
MSKGPRQAIVAQGLTTSQVAERLHHSINSMESHRQKIKDKLAC